MKVWPNVKFVTLLFTENYLLIETVANLEVFEVTVILFTM